MTSEHVGTVVLGASGQQLVGRRWGRPGAVGFGSARWWAWGAVVGRPRWAGPGAWGSPPYLPVFPGNVVGRMGVLAPLLPHALACPRAAVLGAAEGRGLRWGPGPVGIWLLDLTAWHFLLALARRHWPRAVRGLHAVCTVRIGIRLAIQGGTCALVPTVNLFVFSQLGPK